MHLVMTQKELERTLRDNEREDDPSDRVPIHPVPNRPGKYYLAVELGNGDFPIPIHVEG